MRRRLRKVSPMGLMASTMCRFSRTRSVKKLYMERGVASILRPWVRAATCIFSIISAFSSGGYKLGTSPGKKATTISHLYALE